MRRPGSFLALAHLLDAHALDHLFDDLLGDGGDTVSHRLGVKGFRRLIGLIGLILDQRGIQRLAELGAVAVKRVGFEASRQESI